MRVGVPRETSGGERRVALVPETIGAARTASTSRSSAAPASRRVSSTQAYADAGATLVDDAVAGADAVVKVQAPTEAEAARLRRGPGADRVPAAADRPRAASTGSRPRGVVGFAMESIPRTTRAQSMDALSSQATVGGYKAALLAADRLPRFFPMLMTAAGTVAPAKVLVLGAGVAGLQAIATARRLGAIVSGFDVRPAVREQVESLGATFLDLGVVGEQTEGGYARELTPEQQAEQQAALEERHPRLRRRDHDRRDPGRPGAAADPGDARSSDEARLGDRRPRRRDRRELRAHPPGRRDRRERRHDRRAARTSRATMPTTRASSTRATSRRCSSTSRPAASSTLDWDDEITAGACVTRTESAAV